MSSNNAVNPNKTHFEVAHRLFCLLLSNKTKKDKEVEKQWNAMLAKAQKAKANIPAETIQNFSEARPDLAHKLANTPA